MNIAKETFAMLAATALNGVFAAATSEAVTKWLKPHGAVK